MKEEWINQIKHMADSNHEQVPDRIWENVKAYLTKKRRNQYI